MNKETKVAIQAAKISGRIAMRYFGKGVSAETKSDGTPVTIADRLCEKKIISIIRKKFPENGIIGEESGEIAGDNHKWLIDPIDGTKDFVRGAPFFSTLIGLEKDGRLEAGVILFPALKRLIYAERGKGAYVNGKRIMVSKTADMEETYMLHGSLKGFYKTNTSHVLENLKGCWAIRSFSSSFGFAMVAEGIADGNIEPVVKPWDLAATKIVVEEAGGRMSDFNGNDTIYAGNAVASNGKLHDELLEIIRG